MKEARKSGTAPVLEEARQPLETLIALRTAALQESESRYRQLIDVAPDAICVHSDWRIVLANPAMLRMFHAERVEQLVGREVLELIAPRSRDAVRRRIRQLYEERHPVPLLETEYLRIDGTSFSAEVMAAPLLYAGRAAAQVVVRDVTDRKAVEQALRESEARFRSLTELSSDWYWEQDENLRYVMFSGGVENVVGPSVRSEIGKRRWELPAVGVRPEQWDEHRAVLEARRPFRDFEFRRFNDQRELIWISVSGEPMFEADGRFRGYRGIGRNVTRRKLAEQALAESNARFRSLAGLSSDWYWEQDENLRFVAVSPQIEAVMGLPARSDVGKTRWELPTLGVSQEQWAKHRATLESRLPFRGFEYRRLNDRGEQVWLSVSGEPMFGDDGRFCGYRGIGHDITERKRAEEALRASEIRFRSFTDHMPAIGWIKDSLFRYVWISGLYQKTYGKSLEEMRGRDSFEIWPAELASHFRRNDEAALHANGPVQSIDRVPDAAGNPVDWLVVKFPVPDATGAPGVAGIGFDVTERLRLVQTVRQLLRRLVDAQEAERREVAQDLHDLIGQKLSALGINLDVLRQELPAEAAAQVSPRLQQMSALLEETIGAIREVMAELRPPALDEHGLSAALYQYASVFEARTGLRVEMSGPKRSVTLPRHVSIALFRVAQEALANAARHSGASRVQVRIEKEAGRVELHVQDNGHGFRDGAGARARHGGGWGLPAMRERVQTVGGEMSIESTGGGTRLKVVVPLGDADQRHPG